jgi:hypothetical protein
MEKDDDGHPFPNLMHAMRDNHAAAQALLPMTFYRYVKGELPSVLKWFVDHPDLLDALAEDARTMTPERRAKWEKLIADRASAQQGRRDKKAAAREPEPEPTKPKRGKK